MRQFTVGPALTRALYADAKKFVCPACAAQADEPCRMPDAKRFRKTPHLARLSALSRTPGWSFAQYRDCEEEG